MTQPSIIDLARKAGQLIRYGLEPMVRPADADAYRALLREYESSGDLAAVVNAVATGEGLIVMDVSPRGIVLAAQNESPFAMSPAAWRPNATTDDRLIDGLIQVGILATVYPRPADLEENRDIARPPFTVHDVERTLRDLCERLEAESRGQPDPALSPSQQGLIEAWRVYRRRPAVRATPDQRKAARTTTRVIEVALDRLRQHGCFLKEQRTDGATTYQPTFRYQVYAQDYALVELLELVQRLERAPTSTADVTAPAGPPATGAEDNVAANSGAVEVTGTDGAGMLEEE